MSAPNISIVFGSISKDLLQIRKELSGLELDDKSKIAKISSQMISVRNKIFTLETTDATFLNPQISMSYRSHLKHVIKCQSLLIKKITPTDELFETIAHIWQETTGSKSKTVEFGQKMHFYNFKDPIVLEAINSHFSKLENIQPTQLSKIKIFHTSIHPADMKKLAGFERSIHKASLYAKIEDILKTELSLNLKTNKEIHNFILQNRNHPIIKEAMDRLILEKWCYPFLKAIEQSDIYAKTRIAMTIPEFIDRNCFKLGPGLNPEEALKTYIRDLENNIELQKIATHRKSYNKYDDLFISLVTIYDPANSNLALEKSLEIAYDAIAYANLKFICSSNFFNRENTIFNPNNFPNNLEIISNDVLINKKQNEKKVNEYKSKNPKFNNFYTDTILTDKISNYIRFENCQGYAQVAFTFASQRTHECSIKRISQWGDHCFNMIGNDVYADPWARKILSAAYLDDFLDDYLSSMKKGIPKVQPYGIRHLGIELELQNRCTLSDFQKEIKNNQFPKVENLLQNYENSAPDKKHEAAKELLLEAENCFETLQEESHKELFGKLIAELNYFLHAKYKTPKSVVNKIQKS